MFEDAVSETQTDASTHRGAVGVTGEAVLLTLAAFAVLLGVSGVAQLSDPFLKNDDFPALLRDADAYYPKTLQEGRWLNYLWHLRPFDTPAWLNYLVFLLGNAVFAAAVSLLAVGTSRLPLAALTVVLIALAPQSILMTGWFNTLIPGIWILALYAALTIRLSLPDCRRLLFVFVPVTLIAYSTYPLILLVLCLVHRDAGNSLAEYVKTLASFAVALALGISFMFGLNWLYHGVFGLEHIYWREANPAHDLAGVIENLKLLQEFSGRAFVGLGYGSRWLAAANIFLFFAALAVIARRRPVEALSILTGVVAGIVLLSILSLKDGVLIFFRATQFVWAAYAVSLARAAVILSEDDARRGRNITVALAVLISISAVLAGKVFQRNIPYQDETRRIAAGIPDDAREVQILGEFFELPEANLAFIQHNDGVRDRFRRLTGLPVVLCAETPAACADPPSVTSSVPNATTVVETRDGIAYVFLPGTARK